MQLHNGALHHGQLGGQLGVIDKRRSGLLKRHVLLTGIGLGIVRRLAREGARVVVSSRRQQNVDETVAALKAEGLDVVGCVCHVGNLDHIKRLAKVRAGRTCEAELVPAWRATACRGTHQIGLGSELMLLMLCSANQHV